MGVGLMSLSGGMICLNMNMRLQRKNSSPGTSPLLSNKLRSTNNRLLFDSFDFYPHSESETPWIHKLKNSLRTSVAAHGRLQGARAKTRL